MEKVFADHLNVKQMPEIMNQFEKDGKSAPPDSRRGRALLDHGDQVQPLRHEAGAHHGRYEQKNLQHQEKPYAAHPPHPPEIQREIPINIIDGATKSRVPDKFEFVIHVESEYDYRFSSEQYVPPSPR